MEIFIIGVIVIFILVYNKTIDGQKFIKDNEKYFNLLREDDFDFLVYARYGEQVNADDLMKKRIYTGFGVAIGFLCVFLTSLSMLNIVCALVIGYLVYKITYMQLKNYYKNA